MNANTLLKLQSVAFPLSPSLFEICNCSYSRNDQLYMSCASVWHQINQTVMSGHIKSFTQKRLGYF